MQPVTRNCKYPKGLNHVSCVIWSCIVACNLLHEIGNAWKGLNNVPCVVRSCINMHITRQSINYTSGLIIRATSCTLRTKSWIPERIKSRSLRDSVVHQDAHYNMESRSCSVQLVARNEQLSWRLIIRCLKKYVQKLPHFISCRGWFGRASICTLQGNQ